MTFFSDDMGLVTIDLNNINHLDDDNLDEDDPETIVVIWLIAWWNRYMQRKIDRWWINAYSTAFSKSENGLWEKMKSCRMISVMHKRLLVLTHSNLFVPNAPFLNSLKAPKNPKIFWCFQGVEKGCIGNNCVNNFCSLNQKCIMWGWVMTQNWVSQVVSSLGICR